MAVNPKSAQFSNKGHKNENRVCVNRGGAAWIPPPHPSWKRSIGGVTERILDFGALEYLSSAGLRVLLVAQKVMNKQGQMIIRNVNETIAGIFEITGFVDILTIE